MSHICTPYKMLILIAILSLNALLPHAEEATSDTVSEIISSIEAPVKVVDGDSLEIGNARIRLVGIDAPEYDQYCKRADNTEYPCGQSALNFLQNLIGEHPVICTIHEKDKYNRDLSTCYANNINLNAELIRNGFAVLYYESPYQAEELEAKQHKRGIWQGRFMRPALFRKLKNEQKKPKIQNNLNFTSDSY